ncbi:hypothetical protein [Haladaptatus sp. NG-SE-30]
MSQQSIIERVLLLVFGLSFLVFGVYLALQVNSIPSAFARHRLAIGILVTILVGFVFVVTSLGYR